jgi:hypothetical protein
MKTRPFASVSYVDDDPENAAREAVLELRRQLGGQPDWVLAFFSADLDPALVQKGLARSLPPEVVLVGCSSYAEIDSAEALTRSVTLLGCRSASCKAQAASLPADGRSPRELGRALGAQLAPFSPRLLLLFPDVLTVNATQLLRGVQEVFGSEFPIIGGAPADSGAFQRTHLLCGRTLQTSGVVALALRGPLHISTAARSGYLPISIARTATRVEAGNVLLELDGRPALDVYREFLGPRAGEMPAVSVEFPLGIVQEGREAAPALTSAIFKVDEARRALILGGDIPAGGQLRILSAARTEVLAGAKAATELACRGLPNPDVALLFNCMSRKVSLGPRYKDEYAGALSLLPAELPKVGFYTFGELSPMHGVTEHHESTYTLALLKLDEAAST